MSPWGLLTWRGRWLFLAGFAISLVALYRGQRDLLWFGLLLLLLPLGAMLLVRTSTVSLRVRRELSPPQTSVGGDVVATLTIDKDRDLGGGLMLFEESVPPRLGRSPRFSLDQTAGVHRREFTYTISGGQRGRYLLGPLKVETRDALGLVRVLRGHHQTHELLVLPRVHDVPTVRAGGSSDAGDATPHQLGAAGDDDVLVREYRHGDDMRRVHWRSTARHDELMVRREEQTWDPRVTLVLDNRVSAHHGSGPDASLEWAVSAVASLGCHFLARGFRVQVVDAGGDTLGLVDGKERTVARQRLLEFLTDVDLVPRSTFTTLLEVLPTLPEAQLVVAVLGTTTEVEAARLAATRPNRGTGLALLLDAPSFVGLPTTDDVVAAELVLTAAGWQCARAGATSDLAGTWGSMGLVRA